MGKKLGSLKSLGTIGSVKAEEAPCFLPDRDSLWEGAEELTPALFESLEEKYGDDPEWMRVTGYREGRDPVGHRRRSELMLNLTGKDYWFPLSPSVYEAFVEKIVTESRGDGLRYLQDYIRRYRGYEETWPDEEYVQNNKIGRNSFIPESAEVSPSQVGLPQDVIDAIFEMREDGMSPGQIARELHISRAHVESTLTLASGFKSSPISDAVAALASGDMTVEEAVGSMASPGERQTSKSTLRAMTRGSGRQGSVRVRGQKPRSATMRITPNSI